MPNRSRAYRRIDRNNVLSDELMIDYLRAGRWLEDERGLWHPPNSKASWELLDAFIAAKDEEFRGLRMVKQ